MAMLTENATGPGEEEDDDDDETEVGVDLGIAGVAEAGPSPHEEDNLIILHELDLKGVGEDDEDEDEEEEEEEDDEEDDEDQPMVEEQEQVVGQPQQVEEAVADGPVMCSASDLDGFDGIQAIKMETDSIFDSGGKLLEEVVGFWFRFVSLSLILLVRLASFFFGSWSFGFIWFPFWNLCLEEVLVGVDV